MTVCVGLEHGGRVYLGSDSFIGDERLRQTIDRPKIIAGGKDLAFAFAGGVRLANLVSHALDFRPRKKRESPEEYLIGHVTGKIQKAATSGPGMLDEPAKGVSASLFLIACGGRLWRLQDDWAILRFAEGYGAIGVGESVALGALAATDGQEPRERLNRVLRACEAHCNHVSGPFHIVRV